MNEETSTIVVHSKVKMYFCHPTYMSMWLAMSQKGKNMIITKRSTHKMIIAVLSVLILTFALGLQTAISEELDSTANINRYRNMLQSISDLDYSATNATLRNLCALLSDQIYKKDSRGNADTSIYAQLGCINTYYVKKPDAIVGYLLDQYQQPVILIVFEGSTSKKAFEDWRYNIDFWKSVNGIHQGYDNLHSHFVNNLFDHRFTDLPGQPNFIELMYETSQGKGAHFIITGHSLGGAMAQVLTYYMTRQSVPRENIVTYTFASPIPFNRDMLAKYGTHHTYVHNYINSNDAVPVVGINGPKFLYHNGGNIGCNYYLKDTARGSYPQFMRKRHSSNNQWFPLYILKPSLLIKKFVVGSVIDTGAFFFQSHTMHLYQQLIQNEPVRIDALDFSPSQFDESIFEQKPIPRHHFEYHHNYFNRVVNTSASAPFENAYVTTYPNKSNVLHGLVEYAHGSKVSEVGVYLGDTMATPMVGMISQAIATHPEDEYSIQFDIDLSNHFVSTSTNYFQAYAIVDGRTYVGRIEPLILNIETVAPPTETPSPTPNPTTTVSPDYLLHNPYNQETRTFDAECFMRNYSLLCEAYQGQYGVEIEPLKIYFEFDSDGIPQNLDIPYSEKNFLISFISDESPTSNATNQKAINRINIAAFNFFWSDMELSQDQAYQQLMLLSACFYSEMYADEAYAIVCDAFANLQPNLSDVWASEHSRVEYTLTTNTDASCVMSFCEHEGLFATLDIVLSTNVPDASLPLDDDSSIITSDVFKDYYERSIEAYNRMFSTNLPTLQVEINEDKFSEVPYVEIRSDDGKIAFYLSYTSDGNVDEGILFTDFDAFGDGSFLEDPSFPQCYAIASCFANGKSPEERIQNLMEALDFENTYDQLRVTSDNGGWFENSPIYRGTKYTVEYWPDSGNCKFLIFQLNK